MTTPTKQNSSGIVMDAPHVTDPDKRRELWQAYQTTMGSAVVNMGTVGGSMMGALSALFSLHRHLDEDETWAMIDGDYAEGRQTTALVSPTFWAISPAFWYVNQHLGDDFFGFLLLHEAQHLLFYDPLHYDELADAVMQRGVMCRQIEGREPDGTPICGEVYVHHMTDKAQAQKSIHQIGNMLMDLVADQRCREMIGKDSLCKVPAEWFSQHLLEVSEGLQRTAKADNHNPLKLLDGDHDTLDATLSVEVDAARRVWIEGISAAQGGHNATMPPIQELLAATTRAMCFLVDPQGGGESDDGQDGQGGIGDVTGSEADDTKTPEQHKEALDRTLNAATQMAGDSPLFDPVRARAVPSERDWTQILEQAMRNAAGGRAKRSMVRPYPPELRRRVVLPTYKSQPRGTALVMIDTSGSVVWEGGPLARLLGEISGVLRSGIVEQVHVVPCDSEVHPVLILDADKLADASDPLRQASQDMLGGGGTSFSPPFRWLEGQEAQALAPAQGYTGCLYLTDGYGSPPSVSLVNRVAAKFGGVSNLWWLITNDNDEVTAALKRTRGLGRRLRVK